MNSLVRTSKASLWLKNLNPTVTSVRNHWNKDFKPGLYPTTEEERVAAAEKYGIHPKEYELYPDDGNGNGDYPKLPDIGADLRDPFYPWDSPELKRNFGETLHENFDYLREDRMDEGKTQFRPLWVLWAQTIGVIGGIGLVYYLTKDIRMIIPVVPPELPKDGKVHYTFEPNN
ncbi:unnamed protein product [Ceutorhynchus assimilis]|uniref:NADH dehydrogenase [ubiquinone] 1 beta subcomplex subunit 8, mitochondrial n=1 Tax=Ceutorhynchus assimilis TaxID=467358 RepID=A0A9N9MNE4_9CUCU|nr:unnamed protein product [Ceutorhynchus assimilis]